MKFPSRVSELKPARLACSLALKAALSVALLGITAAPHASVEARDLLEVIPAETSYMFRFQGSKHAPTLEESGLDLNFFLEVLRSMPVSPDPHAQFFKGAFEELLKLYQEGKISEVGLRFDDIQVGIYGVGLWPVASVSLSDSTLFKKWLFKRLDEGNIKLTSWRDRADTYDLNCDPKGKLTCLFSLSDGRLSAGFTLNPYAAQFADLMTGVKRPQESLKQSNFVTALAQNANASTHTASFVSFQRVVKTLLDQGSGLNKSLLPQKLNLASQLQPECVEEYLSIVGLMPDIYLGQEEYQVGQPMTSKVLWRFKGGLADASATLSAQDLYRVSDARSLFSLGFSMNIPMLIQAVQKLMQGMIQSPYTCPHLSQGPLASEKLQQGLMVTQMVPPFARNLRGVSFSLLGVQLNQGKPPQADALVIITSAQAPMLLQFLKGAGKEFKDFVVPKVGAPASPLEGLKLPPPLQGLKIKLTQDAIGVALGERAVKELEVALKTPNAGAQPTLRVHYRMSDLLALIKQGLQMFNPKADQAALNMMQSPIESINIGLGFTQKGLEVNSVARMK